MDIAPTTFSPSLNPIFGAPAQERRDADERLELRDPIRVAELLILVALRRRASSIVLGPGGDEYRLVLLHGSQRIITLLVDGALANATIARFAALADLDLLSVASGGANNAVSRRFRVMVDADVGQLLVSIGATPEGLDLELWPLEMKGRSVDDAERGQLKRCPSCSAYASWRSERCAQDGTILVELRDRFECGGTVGSYIVGEVLGSGGMGAVHAAEHALIGAPVAIKVIHQSFADSPTFSRMFLREARVASRIRHPSVISVFDYGLLGDGRPYLVMERVEGESLAAKLERGGALAPRTALLIARTVARALAVTHDSGVVHLDLNPSNVILLEGSTDLEPRLKLIDFGCASRVGDATAEGESQLVAGTPAYMSPEHARGEPADRRSDLYALGIMLYEMLSGELPFCDETVAKVLSAQLSTPAPTVTSPHGTLARPISRIVSRALRKPAGERHQTMLELISDIDAALEVLDRSPWHQWLST